MSRILITLLISMMPLFSIRYDIGITGSTGYGSSRWERDIYDTSGTFITDHLQSNEPVFNIGISTNILFIHTIGVSVGMQYGWYNYKYSHNDSIDLYDRELEFNYKILLLPIELVFGIPVGENRFILGGGFVIRKQLHWSVRFTTGYYDYFSVENISSDDLETTLAPQLFIGIELLKGHFILSPKISYSYNVNSMGDIFVSNIPTHYVMLNVGALYIVQ